jgi:hypothetical protein
LANTAVVQRTIRILYQAPISTISRPRPFDSTIKVLSTTTHIRLLVLLALFLACWTDTPDLRTATLTMTTWALGPILLTKFSLPRWLRRAHALYMLVSSVALAATNDLFYYNTLGRLLDLFFWRDIHYAPDTPGSGFTDWAVTFRRRNAWQIEGAWRTLSNIFWTCVVVAVLFLVSVFIKLVTTPSANDEIERTVCYMQENGGKTSPWLEEKRRVKVPEMAKRVTRYNWLSDELIFVCGPGEGLETVVDGDFEGTVARRRALRKRFA